GAVAAHAEAARHGADGAAVGELHVRFLRGAAEQVPEKERLQTPVRFHGARLAPRREDGNVVGAVEEPLANEPQGIVARWTRAGYHGAVRPDRGKSRTERNVLRRSTCSFSAQLRIPQWSPTRIATCRARVTPV